MKRSRGPWSGWSLTLLLFFTASVQLGPDVSEARSSFWISSRDENACIVSAVFQYNEELEKRIQLDNEIGNAVLQVDIHTKEPQELCTTLLLTQGDHRWRPLLCVTRTRGNIFTGYLVLPGEFTLDRPLRISLGERTIEAAFRK